MRKDKRFTVKKDKYGYEAVCKCGYCRISSPIKKSDEEWDLICAQHNCEKTSEIRRNFTRSS